MAAMAFKLIDVGMVFVSVIARTMSMRTRFGVACTRRPLWQGECYCCVVYVWESGDGGHECGVRAMGSKHDMDGTWQSLTKV